MTTIATDGRTMAGDGQAEDHFRTIVNTALQKVLRLSDGRIVGGCGNSFDLRSWAAWLEKGKEGDCPIASDQFGALILQPDGVVLWVDYKGREIETPTPCAVGSGQDYALGAMAAGASPAEAVAIATRYDPGSGGQILALQIDEGPNKAQ